MVSKTMSCPVYWISAEPEAVLELPCLGRSEMVTLWRCGLCGEWHGLWPEEKGEDEEFQAFFQAPGEEWTEDDYRITTEAVATEKVAAANEEFRSFFQTLNKEWTEDDYRDAVEGDSSGKMRFD